MGHGVFAVKPNKGNLQQLQQFQLKKPRAGNVCKILIEIDYLQWLLFDVCCSKWTLKNWKKRSEGDLRPNPGENLWRCVEMCEDMCWDWDLFLLQVSCLFVFVPDTLCEESLKCTTFAEIILQRLGQLGVAQACFCLPVHDVLVRCLVRDGRRSWHSLEPMSFSSTSQCHICTVNDIWGHKMSDVLWIMYDSVWL